MEKGTSFLIEDGEKEGLSIRLKDVIGSESINSFAKRSGLSEGTVRNIIVNGVMPRLDNLIAMANAAGVTVEWLATGRGHKTYAKIAALSAGLHENPSSPLSPDTDEFVYVNDYSVEASAGHGSEVGHEIVTQRLAFRNDWIKQEGLDPRKLSILWAKGDSMEPSIMHGDILLVEVLSHINGTSIEFGTRDGLPPRDGIYIIRLYGNLVVKRIQLDMQGGFFVKSDNETYEKIHITRSMLQAETQEPKPQITGRVVWFGRSI